VPFVALWGIDPEEDLARVRALRAYPPGFAARGKRRRVFGSALEQFEQLLAASHHVGPATAPITLFYSLSQAGRAIAAAHISDTRRWELRGHGLEVKVKEQTLGETVIEPKAQAGRDSFSVVATAVGSARITSSTTLSAAWAAVPGVWITPGLGQGEAPALLVEPEASGMEWVGRIWGDFADALPHGEQASTLLRERLARYPGAEGVDVIRVVPRGEMRRDEPGAFVSWRDPEGSARPLEEVAPPFIPGGANYVTPGLGANSDPISPLMAWWLVLFVLSSVARYEPALWARALDPDSSPTAVAIERALALWREIGPAAVLFAIRRNSEPASA
jgi:hypothetical protein